MHAIVAFAFITSTTVPLEDIQLVAQVGHPGDVYKAAIRADGRYVASVGYDGSVLLWEVESGRVMGSFFLPTYNTEAVLIHPTKPIVIAAGHRQSERVNGSELVVMSVSFAGKMQRHEAIFSNAFEQYGLHLDRTQSRCDRQSERCLCLGRCRWECSHLSGSNRQVQNGGSRGLPYTRTREITLSNGDNVIEVSVRNARGEESVRHTSRVRYTGPVAPEQQHVFAFGVSTYPESPLDYAAKDARDFATLFAKTAATHVTTDGAVTRASVLALRKALEASTVDDAVVVYIAGHGLREQGRYFFATHDTTPNAPAGTGVAYEELTALFDGISARRKLLLLDTCFAGELDQTSALLLEGRLKSAGVITTGVRGIKATTKPTAASAPSEDANTREQMLTLMDSTFADARRGSGTIILSAASGVQLAAEGAGQTNGLFTYALLEGLRTRKANVRGDAAITASELVDYVRKVVLERSLGEQRPMANSLPLDADFALWR